MTRATAHMPEEKEENLSEAPVDYERLHDLWVISGKPKAEFLRGQGINPRSGHVKRKTRNWVRLIRKTEIELAEQRLKTNPTRKTSVGIWELVKQWRMGQAQADWNAGNKIRQHIEHFLDRVESTDNNAISSRDILTLSKALGEVQRIQRLALGLSTENVGLEKPVEPVDQTPVFEVLVNERGKLVSARPKRVQ